MLYYHVFKHVELNKELHFPCCFEYHWSLVILISCWNECLCAFNTEGVLSFTVQIFAVLVNGFTGPAEGSYHLESGLSGGIKATSTNCCECKTEAFSSTAVQGRDNVLSSKERHLGKELVALLIFNNI